MAFRMFSSDFSLIPGKPRRRPSLAAASSSSTLLMFRLLVKQLHFLRADGLQLQQVEQAARDFGELLLVIARTGRSHEFRDLLGQIGADAGNVREFAVGVARDIFQALRKALNGALGAVVGGSLEGPLGIILDESS
jgi:hypothetical protein